MYRFGSHVSCAGGLLQGVERAQELGCQCLQLFVSTPRAWPKAEKLLPLSKSTNGKSKSKKLQSDEDSAGRQSPSQFRKRCAAAGIDSAIAHACYLINLASPDEGLWLKSVDALSIEWRRAEELQLDGIVLHPGAHTLASVEVGLDNVVRGVRLAEQQVKPRHCPLLLENTAGQGTCLGWKIEQLGYLIQQLSSPMVKVCWDTCHALAAGYDFRSPVGLQGMIDELSCHGILNEIRAIHINDSQKDCGSRVDRHQHIGLGFIGQKGWKLFLKSPEFSGLPMYLETEKGLDENGQDWDQRNLATLRSYVEHMQS